ncbi:hypothetical protein LXA43DRAFT_1097188 [Ganoderma leucocontextum]|nr:hypothetical protein LXA43DRAFT_1097188 [Ganoderma leucocontextum]
MELGSGAGTDHSALANQQLRGAVQPDAAAGQLRESTLPPRRSKAKALGEKVWLTSEGKRKRRTLSDSASGPAPTQSLTSESVDTARPKKSKKAKVGQGPGSAPAVHASESVNPANQIPEAEPPARVHSKAVATKRIPKPRPVGGARRATASGSAQGTTFKVTPRRTVVGDPGNADEEVSSPEEGSDRSNARDDDEQSESGDDDPVLNGGGDDLDAYLAEERPAWQETKLSAKSKGKAVERLATPAAPHTSTAMTTTPGMPGIRTRGAKTPGRYILPLNDFDKTSGSEFEPEEEEDMEEGDKMSVDVDEEEGALSGVNLATASKATKNKAPTKAQLKRQQLETPTWKGASLH